MKTSRWAVGAFGSTASKSYDPFSKLNATFAPKSTASSRPNAVQIKASAPAFVPQAAVLPHSPGFSRSEELAVKPIRNIESDPLSTSVQTHRHQDSASSVGNPISIGSASKEDVAPAASNAEKLSFIISHKPVRRSDAISDVTDSALSPKSLVQPTFVPSQVEELAAPEVPITATSHAELDEDNDYAREIAEMEAEEKRLIEKKRLLAAKRAAEYEAKKRQREVEEAVARLAAEEAARKQRDEEEARVKAAEDARVKALEEARLKAAEEARIKVAEEARLKAAEEARIKVAEEARIKAAEEARAKAAEATRAAADQAQQLEKAELARTQLSGHAEVMTFPSVVTTGPTKAEKLAFFNLRRIAQPTAPSSRLAKAAPVASHPVTATANPGTASSQHLEAAGETNYTTTVAFGPLGSVTNLDRTLLSPGLKSSASSLSTQKEAVQRMMAERAVYDKNRENNRAQEKVDIKNTWTASSDLVSVDDKRNRLDSRKPRCSQSTAKPTLGFTKSWSDEADIESYASALDKLHARPDASKNSRATATPSNVNIPERSSSITPPQPKPTSPQLKTEPALVIPVADANESLPEQQAIKTVPSNLPLTKIEPVSTLKTDNNGKYPQANTSSIKANALPVEKLAFTLRSTSLEKESHPAYAKTTNTDCLATAHAAMNEIDRVNVRTQGELFFTSWPSPEKRPSIHVRRVHISQLPLTYTATQVLSLVWGGRVERVDYKGGSGEATVLFMEHKDCEEYYKATCNGVNIPGQPGRWAMIKLADRAEAAHEFLRGLIDIKATRCIRAIGVDEDLSMTLLTKLAGEGKREVERVMNGTNAKGTRVIEFRFLNIYDAMRFKSELIKRTEWEACNILCVPDPCAKATGVH